MSITQHQSTFISPTYEVTKVSVFDLIGQKSNPNSISSKSFAALQVSVFNTGYSFPIVAIANPTFKEERYNEISDYEKIRQVVEGSAADARSGTGSDTTFATQISDEAIREMFPVQVTDGQQRSSIIRLGTKYFMEDDAAEAKAEKWSKGEDIPFEPGKEMLKFLAWREDFTIPCVVLQDKTEVELMSITVLMNQARGSHSLDSTKEIVYNLINVAGMSEDWVARNLFLDLESIKRMTQLSGLKSAYDNLDEADLAWNPETDGSYQRKQDAYLNREASKYVSAYVADNPSTDTGERRDIGNIQEYAESLGWDKEAAIRIKQGESDVAPNGTRREGRIHAGHIPG